jgi:hypothetical protein
MVKTETGAESGITIVTVTTTVTMMMTMMVEDTTATIAIEMRMRTMQLTEGASMIVIDADVTEETRKMTMNLDQGIQTTTIITTIGLTETKI